MGQIENVTERRTTDPLVLEMRALRQSLDRKHPENVNHMQVIEAKLDQVLAGFPAGDPDGHRMAHEAMIKKAERQAKFWEQLTIKLAEKGIWAVVIFVGAALYWYAVERIKR